MNAEPEFPEWYYEHLARTLGEEQAAWARLPREQREQELQWLHENFNTPDDLSVWPPELGGDKTNVPPSNTKPVSAAEIGPQLPC